MFKIFKLYLSMIPTSGPFYRKLLASSFKFGAQCISINTFSVYTRLVLTQVIDVLSIIQVVLPAALGYIMLVLTSRALQIVADIGAMQFRFTNDRVLNSRKLLVVRWMYQTSLVQVLVCALKVRMAK